MLFISYRIIVGRLANEWRRTHLQRRNYKILSSAVVARTGEEAIATVKPELLQQHQLLQKALRIATDGKIDDAEIILERLLVA